MSTQAITAKEILASLRDSEKIDLLDRVVKASAEAKGSKHKTTVCIDTNRVLVSVMSGVYLVEEAMSFNDVIQARGNMIIVLIRQLNEAVDAYKRINRVEGV